MWVWVKTKYAHVNRTFHHCLFLGLCSCKWREDETGARNGFLQDKTRKTHILNQGPEGERDGSSQGQTQGQEEGHDGSGRLRLVWRYLPADGEKDGMDENER